jgi:hypothetical protein
MILSAILLNNLLGELVGDTDGIIVGDFPGLDVGVLVGYVLGKAVIVKASGGSTK